MDIIAILQSKPVLIGLHLGFAILGIDAFLWLLWKFRSKDSFQKSGFKTALAGVIFFILSWIAGGYYYVVFYGALVKPIIKTGMAPWVHGIIMETKEHIFLFIIPLAMTVLFITLFQKGEIERLNLHRLVCWLAGTIAILGLLIGAMGFIISATARWGDASLFGFFNR